MNSRIKYSRSIEIIFEAKSLVAEACDHNMFIYWPGAKNILQIKKWYEL